MQGAPGSAVARQARTGAVGSFLERFRRSSGVPSAVGDEAAAELAPVFAALDKFEADAQAVRERSERMAARRLHKAREEAVALSADARHRAESERGDALKAGLRAADVAAAEIVARAEKDALAIERRGTDRLPALVEEIVGRVREIGA